MPFSRNPETLPPSRPAQDATQDAAKNLPPELTAYSASGLLGHCFNHPLPLFRPPQQLTELTARFRGSWCGARLCWSSRLGGLSRRRFRRHRSLVQYLVGRLAVDAGVVLPTNRAASPDGTALVSSDGSGSTAWRTDQRAFDRHRDAFLLKSRDERLPDAELADDRGNIQLGIGDKSLGSRADGLLVARRVCTQGVLNSITKLAQNLVRHIVWKLGAEVHADAFGSDQANDLLHALAQRLGRVVEEQLGFIEEENDLRLVQVPHFGQVFEELRQKPEQKARIQPRLQVQLVCGQDCDHA